MYGSVLTSFGRRPQQYNKRNIAGITIPRAFGTNVSKGDEILVMDVMKMETSVTAPCDGTITVVVNATDKVATGDVLATIG